MYVCYLGVAGGGGVGVSLLRYTSFTSTSSSSTTLKVKLMIMCYTGVFILNTKTIGECRTYKADINL